MKIVVFGLSISSSWGNGHATLWRGLCRCLHARGHQVVFYERDVPYYARHRDMTNPPGCVLRLYNQWGDVEPDAMREMRDADVALVTSYCPDALAATDFVTVRRRHWKAVFYDMDAPITLDRLAAGQPVAYVGKNGFRNFDLVFSYAGGKTLDALRERLGARRVHPLYGSVDPGVHGPVDARAEFSARASYLGTYAPDRDPALQALFVAPARCLPDDAFLLAGALYPSATVWPDNLRRLEHVIPALHAAFYCSSSVTVNLTRAAMARFGHCPSGRLFEAAACGVPIATDWWDGLEEFFTPDHEIFVAGTTGAAVAILKQPAAALYAVGRAARARVLREHSAERRACEMEQVLSALG